MKNLSFSLLSLAILGLTGCSHGVFRNRNYTYLHNGVSQPATLKTPVGMPAAQIKPYYVVTDGSDHYKAQKVQEVLPPRIKQKYEIHTPKKADHVKSKLEQGQDSAGLLISEPLKKAWPQVGVVLATSDYRISSSDKQHGFYFLVPKGKVADGNTIMLALSTAGSATMANVYGVNGAEADDRTAVALLALLQKNLS